MTDPTGDIGGYWYCHNTHLLTVLITMQALSANLSPTLIGISEEVHEHLDIRGNALSLIPLPVHSEQAVYFHIHMLLMNYPLACFQKPLANFFPIRGCFSSAGFFILGTVHKCYAEDVITDVPLWLPPLLLVKMSLKSRAEH